MIKITRMRQSFFQAKQKALQKAPPGALHAARHRNKWQYYHRKLPSERKGKYIKVRDLPFAAALAQKKYDTLILESARSEQKLLNPLIQFYKEGSYENKYNSLPDSFKAIVEPVEEPFDSYVSKWLQVPYSTKGFYQDDPEHYSDKKERMRSKTEVLIANSLNHRKIPYIYEKKLVLNNNIIVFPDFTCLHPITREVVYWEHFGRMGDPDYCAKTLKKITTYCLNDITPQKNLIMTFESDKQPLNTLIIEKLIQTYFFQDE